MERGRRIELLALAWKAKVLPLYEPRKIWCLGRDSNSQSSRRWLLRPECIPVPPPRQILAPRAGIEPATNGLTVRCSAAELPGNIFLTCIYYICRADIMSTCFDILKHTPHGLCTPIWLRACFRIPSIARGYDRVIPCPVIYTPAFSPQFHPTVRPFASSFKCLAWTTFPHSYTILCTKLVL